MMTGGCFQWFQVPGTYSVWSLLNHVACSAPVGISHDSFFQIKSEVVAVFAMTSIYKVYKYYQKIWRKASSVQWLQLMKYTLYLIPYNYCSFSSHHWLVYFGNYNCWGIGSACYIFSIYTNAWYLFMILNSTTPPLMKPMAKKSNLCLSVPLKAWPRLSGFPAVQVPPGPRPKLACGKVSSSTVDVWQVVSGSNVFMESKSYTHYIRDLIYVYCTTNIIISHSCNDATSHFARLYHVTPTFKLWIVHIPIW